MVEEVKEFGTELHVEGFRNLSDVRVFDDREIEIVEGRAREVRSTRVAESSRRLQCEASWVVPLRDFSENQLRTGDTVGREAPVSPT